MTWTTDKPTRPGWYWWRYDATSPTPAIYHVELDHKALITRGWMNSALPLVDDGEWAGPLEPPTGAAMTTPTPPAPLVKYQAYELVQLDERVKFTIPAPGVEVYLAKDVERVMQEIQWLDEFVVEPDEFPNDGDRQWWRERLAGIQCLLGQVGRKG